MNDKETLEEAAEKFRSNNPGTMQGGNNTKILNAFIAGAKWQQERSYSEEELLDLLFDFQIHRNDLENCVEAREWFEQFKKK